MKTPDAFAPRRIPKKSGAHRAARGLLALAALLALMCGVAGVCERSANVAPLEMRAVAAAPAAPAADAAYVPIEEIQLGQEEEPGTPTLRHSATLISFIRD